MSIAVTDENVAPSNATAAVSDVLPGSEEESITAADAALAAEVLIRANTAITLRATRLPANSPLELAPEELLSAQVASESGAIDMYRRLGSGSDRRTVLGNAMLNVFNRFRGMGFALQARIAERALAEAARPRTVTAERLAPNVVFHRPIGRPRRVDIVVEMPASVFTNPDTPANSPEELAQLPLSPAEHTDPEGFV